MKLRLGYFIKHILNLRNIFNFYHILMIFIKILSPLLIIFFSLRTLEHYEVIEKIGRGKYSDVFKGMNTKQ